MKRHGNLWPQIVAWNNLELAYRKARKGKSRRLNVQRFDADWRRHLQSLHHLLINQAFRTSRYGVKLVYEPKFRQIYVLPFYPDRIVQHALMNVMEPIWDRILVPQSYACRKGKGVIAGYSHLARSIRRYKYCLKCDISKFYPSINHDIMYQVVEQKIKCPMSLWLLHEIIYSFPGEKNIPIGNYTSQWLANLYLDGLDRWATQYLRVDYLRYCDDFVFFSNDKGELNAIKSALPEILWQNRRLLMSKNDLFPCQRGLDFLGYRFFPNGKILLRKRTARALKRRMRRAIRNIHYGENPRHYQGAASSAVGLLKWCNSYNLRRSIRLSWLVKKTGISVHCGV